MLDGSDAYSDLMVRSFSSENLPRDRTTSKCFKNIGVAHLVPKTHVITQGESWWDSATIDIWLSFTIDLTSLNVTSSAARICMLILVRPICTSTYLMTSFSAFSKTAFVSFSAFAELMSWSGSKRKRTAHFERSNHPGCLIQSLKWHTCFPVTMRDDKAGRTIGKGINMLLMPKSTRRLINRLTILVIELCLQPFDSYYRHFLLSNYKIWCAFEPILLGKDGVLVHALE